MAVRGTLLAFRYGCRRIGLRAVELALAIAAAVAFALTNGFHDAANAIATLVTSRAAPPGPAVALAATFNLLGALVVGTAVASTIAGIVSVSGAGAVAVIGAGALAATCWNIATWSLGLPSSSAHALVGGLAGAALVDSGLGAIHWGGMEGLHPVGLAGVLIALAVSPLLGLGFGFAFARLDRLALHRATRRVRRPIVGSEWAMSAALAFGHGANDGQKAMGVIGALLLADGKISTFGVPLWAKVVCGLSLTLGTALGGWRIIRTVGRRIFRLTSVGAFASQSASTAVVLPASYLGAPVSTTQVVASSVVGVGAGRRRARHVRWRVVESIASAWVLTLPAAAALGAVILPIWRLL
ncbi:MAG: inorganic phosphate transporter [Actinobacteria bacterium]|nr:inorganic phosphate transporter [Actinomycetota bacterium]